MLSNNKQAANASFQAKEIRSDLSGVSLPSSKMKSASGGDYAQSSNVDFPSTGIEKSNLQNSKGATSTSRTNNYARNQSQSFSFGNSDVQYISNPQNTSKSDINALFLLDTRASVTTLSNQSSKRATRSLAAKTASVSTSLTDSKSAKKITVDPGDPGASLPIGHGVWILLALAGAYSVSRSVFRVSC